jgi:hypothetical protein
MSKAVQLGNLTQLRQLRNVIAENETLVFKLCFAPAGCPRKSRRFSKRPFSERILFEVQ